MFSQENSCFPLRTRYNFSMEIKNVAKTVYLYKKRHFAAPLEENKTFFMREACRFGIRENMSQTSFSN